MEELSDEFEFFIFLLEKYAEYKNMTANAVINEWEKRGIVEKIFDNYWMYHTEHITNAFKDIDSLLSMGEYAW